MSAMRFFVAIFTPRTWAAALERDSTLCGFPRPTPHRLGPFEDVRPGDVLACYVKAPAKLWVGALKVETPLFFDEQDALWGVEQDGSASFPARFRTTAMVALSLEQGLPVEETVGVLGCLDPKNWSTLFRRSLTQIPNADGERLLALLREPRQPVAAPPPPPPSPPRKSTHSELVWMLIRLGRSLACDVWIAPDERGKSFAGNRFADHVLAEFPAVGLDRKSRDLVRSIDVLWVRNRAILAAFEVEATTSVYSGLLRLSDLVALQPNTTIDLFIVAPDERREKVRTEILRPVFEQLDPPLRERCRFLSASSLDACLDRIRPPLASHVQPRVIREFAENFEITS